MKLVILSFYSGWVNRGMETVVDELAARLKQRHQVKVVRAVRTVPKYPVSQGLATPGVDMSSLSSRLFIDCYSRQIFKFTLKVWPKLREFEPDIIIPANGGWQSLLMKLYGLRYKAKLVILGQAGLGWDDRWNLLLRPDLFVAVSPRNAQWAKQHCWPGQTIAMIPNGVDLNKFKTTTQKSKIDTGLRRLERPVVLCVAGPEKYKRVEETILAVAALKKGSLLLACGSDVYDTMGKAILGKRFWRQGFKHGRMATVYQRADLFTLVSESSEAFGIAYLEAMACGLPVVATDDALRRGIVGKAGIFIDHPEESASYAHALETAAKKDWGNLPRAQAKKFSWDVIAHRYEEEFNKLQP